MFSSNTSQVSSAANYIEDVFSTYLYTGNGSTQTITNGIDLSTYGGLVWLKYRSGSTGSTYHHVYDSARGKSGFPSYNYLYTNDTSAQGSGSFGPTSFNSNGFSLNSYLNQSTIPYVSWTFRKQAKFFDVVTYTGNSTSGRTVAHNLGSVPGCIIVKAYSGADASTANWAVYHRSLGNGYWLKLESTTDALATGNLVWTTTAPTSTEFSVGSITEVNKTGNTYVAYLFAHDAGGFGLTGTDNVISCGSFTSNANGSAPTITLGWEPQWVLFKKTSAGAEDWQIEDFMRGFTAPPARYTGDADSILNPNTSGAENTGYRLAPTATGMVSRDATGGFSASSSYIYIAIRRGPMKTPTSGTSVYAMDSAGATAPNPPLFNGVLTDLGIYKNVSGTFIWNWGSRLQGAVYLNSASSTAETSDSAMRFDYQDGFYNGTAVQSNVRSWMFRRAPGFFDVVCYTGNGNTTQLVSHNLGVKPELVIQKRRDSFSNWYVTYLIDGSVDKTLFLNSDAISPSAQAVSYTTTTGIGAFDPSEGNISGATYVTYLFATCPGVSKVGTYTGTGALQTINCGFTGGARLVLIKRTDVSGDWYLYDSARGITSGNDPYLLLNYSFAQVTSTNYVDTDSTGFKVTAAAPAALNASGGTYIFLAIA